MLAPPRSHRAPPHDAVDGELGDGDDLSHCSCPSPPEAFLPQFAVLTLASLFSQGFVHMQGAGIFWHDWRMAKLRPPRRLTDTYTFPGFRPQQTIHGLFGDSHARLIRLTRRGKKRSAGHVGRPTSRGTTDGCAGCAICPTGRCASTSSSRCVGWPVGAARP
jgi:hypothetical protein